ncbi:MAG TPA: PIN domain-containing protein [Terriglobales bacterium]|nr:PIN domain-containing protein [Terriglobales bacterium]
MPAPDFLDTNILVYAYDASDRRKQQIAQALLRKALSGQAITSTQALGEFAATLLHKSAARIRPESLLAIVDALGPIQSVPADPEMVRRAIQAHARYGVHFYDGMVVAAAERGGCKRIWSEDLNSGQDYFGVVVENPFR